MPKVILCSSPKTSFGGTYRELSLPVEFTSVIDDLRSSVIWRRDLAIIGSFKWAAKEQLHRMQAGIQVVSYRTKSHVCHYIMQYPIGVRPCRLS